MDVNLDAFSRHLDDLIGRFADLGAKLGEAASELQAGGAPPGDSLVEALAAARLDFVELRAEIVLAAETLGVAVPDSVESAKSLEPVLVAMAEVLEIHRRRVAFDDARNRVIAVLDRIESVRHEDDPEFGPLVTVKLKAADLKQAALEITEDNADRLASLAESIEPFANLLTMLEMTERPDEAAFSALEESVGRVLGRQIVVAAARHRLLLAGQLPLVRERPRVAPPEAEPVVPREAEPAEPAVTPEPAVTSEPDLDRIRLADALPVPDPVRVSPPEPIVTPREEFDAASEPPAAVEPVATSEPVPTAESTQLAWGLELRASGEPAYDGEAAQAAEPLAAAEPAHVTEAGYAPEPEAADALPTESAADVPASPVYPSETPAAPEPTLAAEPIAAPEPTVAAEPISAPEPTVATEASAAPNPTATGEPLSAPQPPLTAQATVALQPAPPSPHEAMHGPESVRSLDPVAAAPAASAPQEATDETAQWWLAAWARWSGWKNTMRFPDAVREELGKYPYLLSVPVQDSAGIEEGLLAYGYSILLDHVERAKPGAIANALNSLKTGAAEPVGSQLYAYLVNEGRLTQTYPEFVKNVLVAAVPEPGPWVQARIIHSKDDTRVIQRPTPRVGETEQTARRFLADAQRFREHKFAGTLPPLTTRFFLIQADLRDAHRVEARLIFDNALSDSALVLAVPAQGKSSSKVEVRRFASQHTAVAGLGRDYRAVWFAVFNAHALRRADFELALTLQKDVRPGRK